MNLKRLLNIRPKPGASIPELREAIGAAETARAEANQRAESLMAQRAAIVQAPDWTGPSYAVCRNAASVARRFPVQQRHVAMTFQHHAEVAALPPDQAEAMLERAASEGLSTRALRAEVGKLRNAAGLALEKEALRTARATYFAVESLDYHEREGLEAQEATLFPNVPEVGAGALRSALGASVFLPSLDGTAPIWRWPAE